MKSNSNGFVICLDQISIEDYSNIGGKAINLSKLIQAGIIVPKGFCITTEAFDFFLKENDIQEDIQAVILDKSISSKDCSLYIESLFSCSNIPEHIQRDIRREYQIFSRSMGSLMPIAVRSSASAEDSSSNSFAGQFDSFLGVKNIEELFSSLINCWLSLFSARSIAYARQKKIHNVNPLKMAVIVQRLVNASKAGVLFTINPVNQNKDTIVIEATFGLADELVSGIISPDTFILSKNDFSPIYKDIVRKTKKNIFSSELGRIVKYNVKSDMQVISSLEENELIQLAKISTKIEVLFGIPQDIEWAIENDKIIIIQSRSITTLK